MGFPFKFVSFTVHVVVITVVVVLVAVNIANGASIPNINSNSPNSHRFNNNSEFSKHEDSLHLLKTLHSTGLLGKSINPGMEAQLLEQAIFPSYLQAFFAIFKNGKAGNWEHILKALLYNVADTNCQGHVAEWLERATFNKALNFLSPEEAWVLKMFDSWGKPPEGVLQGHVNAYGDFDECVDIKVNSLILRNDHGNDPSSKGFEGRYCTVYLSDYNTTGRPNLKRGSQLAMQNNDNGETGGSRLNGKGEFKKLFIKHAGTLITPSIGVCFPNSCSHRDVQQVLVNAVLMMYTKGGAVELGDPNEKYWPLTIACYQDKKPDFDVADISVIALISTIGVICLSAGVIDYWLNHGVDKPPKRGTAYNCFMAFSLYTNIRKWLSTSKRDDDLGCLHGIRFFSTSWVVLAHTYYVITFLPSWNMVDFKTMYNDWSLLPVINSTFAVDTFFVMSGMLVGYNILKMLDKTKGKLNISMLYIHRYLRLTPTYAILIGIMATIVPYLGNGPYWAVMTRWGTICEDNWWTNLLYVNNFVNTSWLCQGETWYLANDMQFYILSPFILYPMWRWEMVGLGLLTTYSVLSILSPALLVYYYDTTPTLIYSRDMEKWFTHIYIRPYARIQTFLVGIWLAWILRKTKGKKVRLPKTVVMLLWALSTLTVPFLLYSIQPWFNPETEIPKMAGLAYAGLSRVAWGLVVAWIIFACVKGYGGLVNDFLSWSVFVPLGRLCFCVYLVSLHLQMILHIRFTQPMRFDSYTQVNFFFAHLLMSYIVGFFCSLLFESPFMILQKLIFEGGGNRPAEPVLKVKIHPKDTA